MILDTKAPWIQVELSFDKEEENPYSIALPEDYRPAESPYKAVSVVRDPEGEYKYGDVVVLPKSKLVRRFDEYGSLIEEYKLVDKQIMLDDDLENDQTEIVVTLVVEN